ncbi:MAG: hypothetical protein FWD97_00595 [Defluviitaleaceae bacterium]|nr:hypothetical protein [Defluviitaleaceae bacterium]
MVYLHRQLHGMVWYYMVGAGIARPSSTGNAVQPLRLVPAEMGRAMPAPTSMLLF